MNIPTMPSDTVAPTRRRPASPADLHRLAGLARERNVQVFQDAPSGRWYATSATRPGACYYVTGLSCECEGFVYHQRCSHHAALLERLNWLPPVADAANALVAVAPPCARCHNRGFTYAEAGPDEWPFEIPCAECSAQDDDGGDDAARWNDDLAESAPDDSSRFSLVAARYPTGRVA